MKQSQTKKVYIYPIKDNDGTPLDLINVLTHVPDHSTGSNVLDRVDTFIGRNDRGEYIKAAPSSTKNKDGKRDPEMHQTKKGNQWYHGMKVHAGVDAGSGYVHTITGTTGTT